MIVCSHGWNLIFGFSSDVQVIQMMIRETSPRVSATSDNYLSKLSGPSRQMKTIHFFLAVYGLVLINPHLIKKRLYQNAIKPTSTATPTRILATGAICKHGYRHVRPRRSMTWLDYCTIMHRHGDSRSKSMIHREIPGPGTADNNTVRKKETAWNKTNRNEMERRISISWYGSVDSLRTISLRLGSSHLQGCESTSFHQ